MVRQARSEATRQKILDAAVDAIDRIGYASVGMGDIVERSELTKGALYYHFDSKDSLASAIMDEGSARLLDAFHAIRQAGSPALVNTIDGMFAVAEIIAADNFARIAAQLMNMLGDFNEVSSKVHETWLRQITAQVQLAAAEGDLRKDLEPEIVAELILSAMLSALTWNGQAEGERFRRYSQTCEILLRAVISDAALPFYKEFLARKSARTLPALAEDQA